MESGERWAELVGVQLNGTARVVTDMALIERVTRALDEKYAPYRTPRAEMPEATRRHYDVSTAVIEIVPDARVLSWDNSRLWA